MTESSAACGMNVFMNVFMVSRARDVP